MYGEGTKLKVIEAGTGAGGCNGETGVVVTRQQAIDLHDKGYSFHGMLGTTPNIFYVLFEDEKEIWRVNNRGTYKVIKPTPATKLDREDNTVIYAGATTVVLLNSKTYGVNGAGKLFKGISKYDSSHPEHPYDEDDGYEIAYLRAIQRWATYRLKKLTK